MSVNAVWFEIPSIDFERAVKFYETVFEVKLHRENVGGAMATFPTNPEQAGGAIVEAQAGYVPSSTGAVIYLNGGTDLAPVLARAAKAGGSVVVPKTALPPGMGHFAHFQDTEGNRVGLHSMG
jgi:uncharacterized protein